MSPQDIRRMVLAWELVPQNAAPADDERPDDERPDDEQAPATPHHAGSPPADGSKAPAITSAIRRKRLQDA